MSISVSQFLYGAAAEIRVARAGDVLAPDDQDLLLLLFNELLDALNADGSAVYNRDFAAFTLTPSLSPHTIGVGGSFVTTQRPQTVDAIELNLGGTPNVFLGLNQQTEEWYQAQNVPGLSTAIPTDFYYSPDWPLGKIYFYPVPSTAYAIRLWTRLILAQVAATDTLDLPPGYQQALRLMLAELAAPAFGQTLSPATMQNVRAARERVWGANYIVPNLRTRDAGMPGGRGGVYDYRTGLVT